MTFQEAIQEFLTYCEVEKNQSPKTLENYSRYLSELQLFFGKDKEIESLDRKKLMQYRLHLKRKEIVNAGSRIKSGMTRTISMKTQNYYLIAVRAMLKYLIKLDIEVMSPDKIELPKVEERVVDFLDKEELEKLFASVNILNKTGRRDLAILECLYSTGLRVSELCNLNRLQVNLETKEFAVRGKGGKIRIVFLSDAAVQRIREYLATRADNYEPLFISSSNRSAGLIDVTGKGEKFRLGRDTVEKVVQKYRLQSGILKNVTPHTLRHSFATELLKNGADIRSVQEMLGHSSITTTQIYTHVTHSKLRETHNKFHK